jgi:hypothetical protein
MSRFRFLVNKKEVLLVMAKSEEDALSIFQNEKGARYKGRKFHIQKEFVF